MMRVGGKSDETKATETKQSGKAGDGRRSAREGPREGGIHKAARSFEDVHHDTTSSS